MKLWDGQRSCEYRVVVVSTAAWYLQGHLIYHPRPYTPVVLAALRRTSLRLPMTRPRDHKWHFICRRTIAPRTHLRRCGYCSMVMAPSFGMARHLSPGLKTPTGFLLIDYPGYGKCAGRSSRDAIVASLKLRQTPCSAIPLCAPRCRALPQGTGLFPGGGCGAGARHTLSYAAHCAPRAFYEHPRHRVTPRGVADYDLAPGTV